MFQPTHIAYRIQTSVKKALPKGLKTAWWLIKITIPVSFVVMLLNYSGILYEIGKFTSPLFNLFGLPGIAAVVLITSIFTNVYSAVAILALLHVPEREGIIMAVMCLISHNFPIETAVLKKTGSSATGMILLRIAGSFVAAWLLNLTLPGANAHSIEMTSLPHQTLTLELTNWAVSTGKIVIKILILVCSLLILQQLLEEFDLIKYIVKVFSPLMKIMGLPKNTTISWVVGYVIGLAYGSAIMIDQCEKQNMTKEEANLLNHHLAISHSQLEDPLLFLTLNYPILWLIWPRVLIAIVVVWIYRGYKRLYRNIPSLEMNTERIKN